jgi:flagellar biosynthesis protein FliR
MATSTDSPVPGSQPPPVGCLVPTVAFFGSLAFGLVVTVLVVRAIPPEVPHPTEAYEGFGDAVTTLFNLIIGAALSILAALFTAIFVAVRGYAKMESK